tara:strand:+ start:549 stop:692 length:144 start_codon:yes stop_codon:yes gene_type:complete
MNNMILVCGVLIMMLIAVGCSSTPVGFAYDIVSLPFEMGHVILKRIP